MSRISAKKLLTEIVVQRKEEEEGKDKSRAILKNSSLPFCCQTRKYQSKGQAKFPAVGWCTLSQSHLFVPRSRVSTSHPRVWNKLKHQSSRISPRLSSCAKTSFSRLQGNNKWCLESVSQKSANQRRRRVENKRFRLRRKHFAISKSFVSQRIQTESRLISACHSTPVPTLWTYAVYLHKVTFTVSPTSYCGITWTVN